MFIGTLKLNRALPFVFGSLAVADIAGSATLKRIAGYEGILCGIFAICTGLAQVLNQVHGKTLVPLGPVK